MPDYSQGIEWEYTNQNVEQINIAPDNGWVYFSLIGAGGYGGDNYAAIVKVNGNTIVWKKSYSSGVGTSPDGMIPVKKGDYISIRSTYTSSSKNVNIRFFPCK